MQSMPPSSQTPDPFDVGKLATEVADIKERLDSIDADIGHVPGKNGFDDKGAGALKMLWEIRQNTVSSSRRHAAWGGLAAAVLVAIVKTAEGLGFLPVPHAPPAPPIPVPIAVPAPAR